MEKIKAGISFVAELDPQDSVEFFLASQLFAVQTLSMNLASRAVKSDQTYDIERHNLNQVAKLMRTFTNQMEALTKYRAKGKQKIIVQHVNVENGGQAIVDDVTQGGGNE